MKVSIATLELKDPTWNRELINTIKKAGYTMVKTHDGVGSAEYIIAHEVECFEDEDNENEER